MEEKQRSSRWAPLCTKLGYYNPLMAGSIDGTDKVAHDRGVVRAMTAKCKTFTICQPFMISIIR